MVNTFPVTMTAISSVEIAMNAVAVGFNMTSCLFCLFLLSVFEFKDEELLIGFFQRY